MQIHEELLKCSQCSINLPWISIPRRNSHKIPCENVTDFLYKVSKKMDIFFVKT